MNETDDNATAGEFRPPRPYVIGQLFNNRSAIIWTGRVTDVTAKGIVVEVYHPLTGAVIQELCLTVEQFEVICEVCATLDVLQQRLSDLTLIAFAQEELRRGATVN